MEKHKALRRAREGLGLSQEGLARAVGVSLKTVNNVERGAVDPSLSIALDVADALGEDTSRLRALFDLPKTDRKGGAQ